MIGSLFAAIKKEFNIMLKEKMILVVIIIIPLCTNLLMGYEFNKGVMNKIPMAVYDEDNSSMSRMIVEQFRENDMFDIKYYLDDSNDMEKLMNDSKIRVGMIIPKGFSKDILKVKSPSILMVYDGSHMPIAAAAKKKASEILLTLKTGILFKVLKAKLKLPSDVAEKMALAVNFSSRTLYNPSGSYKNFLNVGFGSAIIQSGIAIMSASAIRASELKKEKRKKLGYLLGKIIFYSLIGWFSLLISILLQYKVFKVTFRGEFLDGAILSLALTFSVSTFGIMVSTLIKNPTMSTLLNSVIFVPNTVMVGYTWPVLSMPEPYKAMAGFYPFYHFADNLRNLFLKGISMSEMSGDIIWLIKFTMIMLIISILGVIIRRAEKHTPETSQGEEGNEIVVL